MGTTTRRITLWLTVLAIAPTLAACSATKKLPWTSSETIVDSDPANDPIPPIALAQANDRHVVAVRAPSGGWSLHIDKDERTPLGRRVFVTIRRPDPAFMHTQALVDHNAITDVPVSTPVEIVARVLDHNEDPRHRVYARVQPRESLD